jgi:release factor glutamine methyltransferase
VDAILSNPPYIPSSVIPTLAPEVRQEPAAALDGGEDGLVFYRAILRDYVRLLAPGGVILLEIGYDQGDALRGLCAQYLPTAEVDVLRDLGGCDRVVRIRTQG